MIAIAPFVGVGGVRLSVFYGSSACAHMLSPWLLRVLRFMPALEVPGPACSDSRFNVLAEHTISLLLLSVLWLLPALVAPGLLQQQHVWRNFGLHILVSICPTWCGAYRFPCVADEQVIPRARSARLTCPSARLTVSFIPNHKLHGLSDARTSQHSMLVDMSRQA